MKPSKRSLNKSIRTGGITDRAILDVHRPKKKSRSRGNPITQPKPNTQRKTVSRVHQAILQQEKEDIGAPPNAFVLFVNKRPTEFGSNLSKHPWCEDAKKQYQTMCHNMAGHIREAEPYLVTVQASNNPQKLPRHRSFVKS